MHTVLLYLELINYCKILLVKEDVSMDKHDIINYTYYNDQNKYIVILDKEKIKKLFNADIVAFEEDEDN